jgi:hypothetical protein
VSRYKAGRSRRGALTAELPGTLWVLFFLLTFPLLNLATVTLRYTFLVAAARDAATAASKAKTFSVDLSASEPSSVNVAPTVANQTGTKFTGITIIGTQTNLVITNLVTQVTTKQTTRLTSPADTTTNLYGIEVVVTGDVQPFLPYTPVLGNIPGLTGPMRVNVASTEMAENPQGLDE